MNAKYKSQREATGLVSNLAGRVLRVFRTGLGTTIERQLSRVKWNRFERRLGLETNGNLNQFELGVNDRGFGYQPIDYLTLQQAFVGLPDCLTDGGFVDFGCGKGRALLFAAMHGFESVCGVEFNKELAETARQNLERLGAHRRSRRHRVVHSDATQFQVPDSATVLFFYNPFAGEILQETLGNIHESLVRRPRELFVIYALPKFDTDLMAQTPWLSKREEIQTCNSDWERLTVYRSNIDVPASQDAANEKQELASADARTADADDNQRVEEDAVHAH